MHILKPLPISILEPKGKTAEIVNPMIAQWSDVFLSTEKTIPGSIDEGRVWCACGCVSMNHSTKKKGKSRNM